MDVVRTRVALQNLDVYLSHCVLNKVKGNNVGHRVGLVGRTRGSLKSLHPQPFPTIATRSESLRCDNQERVNISTTCVLHISAPPNANFGVI